MTELFTFRISRPLEGSLFHGLGYFVGDSVRVVEVDRDDPLFEQIWLLAESYALRGQRLFSSYQRSQVASRSEIDRAQLFRFNPGRTYTLSSLTSGTEYDESTACPFCGAGSAQKSKLRIDISRLPKNRKIALTSDRVILVRKELAQMMEESGLTGFELREVEDVKTYKFHPLLRSLPSMPTALQKASAAGIESGTEAFKQWLWLPEQAELCDKLFSENNLARNALRKVKLDSSAWLQLVITNRTIKVVEPTELGILFDPALTAKYRCPLGHRPGVQVLSNIWFEKDTLPATDFASSTIYHGLRVGTSRPRPIYFASPRLQSLFRQWKIHGLIFEIAIPK